MSPGSKKLLRERDMRKSWAREEGLAGAGLAGNGGLNPEPSSALTAGGSTVSPGRRAERRVRTVMEMYRECTFQPQVRLQEFLAVCLANAPQSSESFDRSCLATAQTVCI